MTETNTDSNRTVKRNLLSQMRIRKKLIVIHTGFSICFGLVLLAAIRPALIRVIYQADVDHAFLTHELLQSLRKHDGVPEILTEFEDIEYSFIPSEKLINVPVSRIAEASASPYSPTFFEGYGIAAWYPQRNEFLFIESHAERARESMVIVYFFVMIALLGGYALMALLLEVWVLPSNFYRPLKRILDADQAVRDGTQESEIIENMYIPADELGMIMRSRNESILALRRIEQDLAETLGKLEHTAADLHKKNHLLETARKNLEGADRLVSLGMMSAGIAHELNTPLAVVKGLVDKLGKKISLSDSEISLLTRVVGRLEVLSDGLLDFARVRPPLEVETKVSLLIDEACTLVLLDRVEQIADMSLQIINQIDNGQSLPCDPNRMVQVFVNLIRNAIDALVSADTHTPRIVISSEVEVRDGVSWLMIRIEDNGRGIDSELIDRLFEPFVSSRLDSHGTGLGLAVANGIVHEHGGVLVATNLNSESGVSGALFEVVLPMIIDQETA